jgi:hypothetical protein
LEAPHVRGFLYCLGIGGHRFAAFALVSEADFVQFSLIFC